MCLSGELLSALTCHPEYKLLSVSTVPQMPSASVAYSTFSWPGMLKHLRQMLISNTKMEEGKDHGMFMKSYYGLKVEILLQMKS